MRWPVLILLCCTACGGSTTTIPTGPSPQPSPSTWALTGRVIGTIGGQAISGAKVMPYNVTTGSDGSFTATGSGSRTTDRVTIDASGFVSRQTTIASSATAPTLDLFPSSALDFYRQMVRNGFEAPGNLQPLRRWTSAPQFYISQDGQLSTEDIRRITVGIQAAVAQLTPFSSPIIAVGASRADQAGWVSVVFINEPQTTGCGFANVGANPGRITINRKPLCETFCPGIQPGSVAHEVGHALGFYHTNTGVMEISTTPADCSDNIQFTSAERQAAAIAYQRPNGNLDPDVDPN